MGPARHAQQTGAFAMRDRHPRPDLSALVEAANRLAASLAGHGLRSGERVAVWLPIRSKPPSRCWPARETAMSAAPSMGLPQIKFAPGLRRRGQGFELPVPAEGRAPF